MMIFIQKVLKIPTKLKRKVNDIIFKHIDPHIDSRKYNSNTLINESYVTANCKLFFNNDIIANIVGHKFNVLGSGSVEVSYGVSYKGYGGYIYDFDYDEVKIADENVWLSRYVNESHLAFSKYVWKYVGGMLRKYERRYHPIDWQVDFRSGYRWSEKCWYKKINLSPCIGVDVKVPWELSRCQHLVQIALAYESSRTNCSNLLFEFKFQVLDFIAMNPLFMGVNWYCAMDVAIRASNWLYAFDIFNVKGVEFDNEFKNVFSNSIYLHGKFIKRNLENIGSTSNNHYISDLVGLLFISSYLKQNKQIRKWNRFAITELKKEMSKQIYNDGTSFEASTCYHCLDLELFFHSTLMAIKKYCKLNKEKCVDYKAIGELIFGQPYISKLYKMFDALCYLLKPNGTMPQIGDNDSGVLFNFMGNENLNKTHLLSFGAVFFNEYKWKIKEFKDEKNINLIELLFGEDGVKVWEKLPENNLINIKSIKFEDSGWYVMRDNENYCIISCGPNGTNGIGGHAHNDKLSYELMINKKDIVIDPGTYTYIALPKERNLFRSTLRHSTLILNGLEQSELGDIFKLQDTAYCKCMYWHEDDKEIIFKGSHVAYGEENKVVRLIRWNKKENKLYVNDKISSKINSFKNTIILKNKENINRIKTLDSVEKSIEPIDISFSYGEKETGYLVSLDSLEYSIS